MGRILLLILGLLIVGFLGYRSMYGGFRPGDEAGTPKQRLENVKKAANRIEDQQQQAADEALKKSAE